MVRHSMRWKKCFVAWRSALDCMAFGGPCSSTRTGAATSRSFGAATKQPPRPPQPPPAPRPAAPLGPAEPPAPAAPPQPVPVAPIIGAAAVPPAPAPVKIRKRAPARCRKCGHQPKSDAWASFHVEPADAVKPCARRHERNLPQNRAAPDSYCTVPPDQRLPGFPLAPGAKFPKPPKRQKVSE